MLVPGLAQQGKAILLVDQNIKGALGIADYLYVMRTGSLHTEGKRAEFGEDVELLVSQWLYTHHRRRHSAASSNPARSLARGASSRQRMYS